MLKINPRRLSPESKDWLLTDQERLEAPHPLDVQEAQLLQTFRELPLPDRSRILALALSASVRGAPLAA